jgi:hypothetical protein
MKIGARNGTADHTSNELDFVLRWHVRHSTNEGCVDNVQIGAGLMVRMLLETKTDDDDDDDE